MSKETITLEFNEQQQQFHHNDGSHELNTQGWVTIMENCTDEIGVKFTEYVDKLNGDKKLTLAFVKQCVATFTKKSKVAYISGKITGMPYEDAYKKFADTERFLVSLGYLPINPMKLNHNHGKTWSEYMRVDIAEMMKADVIVLHSDWQESKGAKLEKYIAESLEMKIRNESTMQFKAWMNAVFARIFPSLINNIFKSKL